MKQTRLPSSWVANASEFSDSHNEQFVPEESKKQKPQIFWTRVKSIEQMKNQRLTVYDAFKDLDFDKNLKSIRREVNQMQGKMMFDPDQ